MQKVIRQFALSAIIVFMVFALFMLLFILE